MGPFLRAAKGRLRPSAHRDGINATGIGRTSEHIRELFGRRDRRTNTNTPLCSPPCSQSDHRRLFDAGLRCNGVPGLETDATNIPGEPIRVLRHDLDGVRPVGLEDANRPGGADPVAVKEDHDLPHDLLSAQASVMRFAQTAPIPFTSRSRPGSASMTSKTFSPKAWIIFWRRLGRCPGSFLSRDISRFRRLNSAPRS
jgi:hypothetical protein